MQFGLIGVREIVNARQLQDCEALDCEVLGRAMQEIHAAPCLMHIV
jgi:hypothetical protein